MDRASSRRRCAARARRTRRADREAGRASEAPFASEREDMLRRRSRHGTEKESMSTLAFKFEEIAPRELRPEVYELDGISRASVEAHYKLYQGYVSKRNEILGKLADVDLAAREPGLLGAPRAEGRPDVRHRRHQEPRALLRAPRRRRRRPDRLVRRARQARLRLGRGVARRPEGDRDRRARLGVDRVRLGRGAALQLHRRRAEHVPGLERDAARRTRRLRARVLPRLPDRPRVVHRRVLRQPRLGRRQRLGRAVRHSRVAARC